jgi:hypothetical protein
MDLLATALRPTLGPTDQTTTAVLAGLTISGFVSAWDAVTGANTVTISGVQTFEDLAILCDPADLAVNVRVLLLRTAGRPVILGRLRVPPF